MNPSPIATLTFDLKNRVRYEFNSQGLTPFTLYKLSDTRLRKHIGVIKIG